MERVRSRKFLKPKLRLPYQTTGFIYKALDVAEDQIEEQLSKIDELEKENKRLKALAKAGAQTIRERRK